MRMLYRRIMHWWLVRKLHGECVMWDEQLRAGQEAPVGACITCAPRIARLRRMAFSRYRMVALKPHE